MRSLAIVLVIAAACDEPQVQEREGREPFLSPTDRVANTLVDFGFQTMARARLARLDATREALVAYDEYYDSPVYKQLTIEPLRILVARDAATDEERLRLARLLTAQRWSPNTALPAYYRGLAEIYEGLAIHSDCANLDELVNWTRERPDLDYALEHAESGCSDVSYHRMWAQLRESRLRRVPAP